MTEKSIEVRWSNEIHNLGAQLSDRQNLADALTGVSDAMQRLLALDKATERDLVRRG